MKDNAHWKDSLRIFLANVNDVDETFLNGVKIGQTGSLPEDAGGYVSKWPYVRSYHLPVAHPSIRWDKENVLAIRVYDGGGTGGIFMGAPFIDILERTDGLTIRTNSDSIRYEPATAAMPVKIINRFNTVIKGTFAYTIHDISNGKRYTTNSINLQLPPFGEKQVWVNTPHKDGIRCNYRFTETGTGLQIADTLSLPYLLTPPTPEAPRINNAPVFGVRPGHPLLFRIAATGKAPLTYHATGLPEGVALDSSTGILTGIISRKGNYTIQLTVNNKYGTTRQSFLIKADSLLSLTPPMGWNSWNCWGLSVSEEKVKSSAQALLDKGLAGHGWSYINIDDGWQAAQRTAGGDLLPNNKFPDIKGLGDWLHTHGLKFGIYSSPGTITCGGYLGSLGHEEQDAALYAKWGVDYLKYDWCSYDQVVLNDTTTAAYKKPFFVMQQALRRHNRDIVYNLCQYGMKQVWQWGPLTDAQSWRTTEDIEDTWQSLYDIGFHQHALYPWAGPGKWNDPDMMIVGQVGWGENLHPTRLTPDEQYTHVSLWCLLSAPLLIGCDISRLDAFTLNLLTNDEVLAVDQDTLGKQAQRIIYTPQQQVWVKELADGSKAIGIFNMDTVYRDISVNWNDLGLPAAQRVRNLWTQKDMGLIKEGYKAHMPPHGVLLLKTK